MDSKEIIHRVIPWMLNREWKKKIAKCREFHQSLFEHSLVELDAALQLLQILRQPNHFGLSPEEEQILVISLVAHDVGKERPEWQEYISGHRGFLSDVDPALTRSVLPDLCETLGFSGLDQRVMAVIENCVNLHMSHERRDANVLMAMLQGADRWYALANLVYHIDNVCSAKGISGAKNALEQSPLGKHLKTTYHQVVIRGVSTPLLHRAAMEAYQEIGWIPVLYFGDATLYVCSAAQSVPEPCRKEIEVRLVNALRETTGRDVVRFMVGSPTANILPKPELFEYREIRLYLKAAARKIGRTSFLKAYEREKKRIASGKSSASGRGKSKAEVIEDYWVKKGRKGIRYSAEMDQEASRISSAHPDMLAFKFFKAAMRLIQSEDAIQQVQEKYEAILGPNSWADLISTSTLMPAQDMLKTVDRFWRLPGDRFGEPAAVVEELAPQKRTQLLIDVLVELANYGYAAIPNPPTRETLAREMASAFVQDLVHPAPEVDLKELAHQQMKSYAVSKPFAGRESRKARYMCPICNASFEKGTKAAADFIDKPESHTNRGVAHAPFGYINICNTCKYERILRQLLLGKRTAELIIIFPRMNIGPGAGELLVRKAQALYDRAYTLMIGDTDDPDRRLWLALTHFVADQMLNQDLYRLTPQHLVDLLTYRSGEEKRRENRRQLEKVLKEAYEEDLDGANVEWGTDFTSWNEAVDAVYANRVSDPTARQIRAEIYRLHPQMQLICQTPHMILLPVSYPIKLENDSEANSALRRTFIALLIGLNLDSSVAIVHNSDQIDFQGGEGVAYVPPVAAVRELIGSNWVPLGEAELWFRRIGIASILANAGQYSERSGLLEVLTAPTAGHILRRIEQKRAADKLRVTYQDIAYLRMFEEVTRPQPMFKGSTSQHQAKTAQEGGHSNANTNFRKG